MKVNIKNYLRELSQELDKLDETVVCEVADVIWKCFVDRRRMVVCGNGGSASTASHFATDMQKGMNLAAKDKTPWEVLSLCDSIPLITAWSNDTEYKNVFAAQAQCWLRPGDVLVAISGSGMSPNILSAVEAANTIGATTIGMCGYGGGTLAAIVDYPLVLPSRNMQHVEDIHMIVAHAIFAAMRDKIDPPTTATLLDSIMPVTAEARR